VVRIHLEEKEENSKKLEDNIVSLRKELEKTTNQLNKSLTFGKSTEILYKILNYQRYPFEKNVLGYSEKKETTKEDPTSSKHMNERKAKSYVDVLKIPIEVEDNRREEQNIP
jgi:hypothetical protein